MKKPFLLFMMSVLFCISCGTDATDLDPAEKGQGATQQEQFSQALQSSSRKLLDTYFNTYLSKEEKALGDFNFELSVPKKSSNGVSIEMDSLETEKNFQVVKLSNAIDTFTIAAKSTSQGCEPPVKLALNINASVICQFLSSQKWICQIYASSVEVVSPKIPSAAAPFTLPSCKSAITVYQCVTQQLDRDAKETFRPFFEDLRLEIENTLDEAGASPDPNAIEGN